MTAIAMTHRGPILGTVLLLASILIFPQTVAEAAWFALHSLVSIGPVILVALLVTATATASGAIGLMAAAMRGRQGRMIALASLIGALTPVCGISVFPLVAGLIAAGVPLAPIMAFWLSSPITGPGMLAITAGTLGMTFAVGKTVAAVGCGLVGGLAVYCATRLGYLARPARGSLSTAQAAGGCAVPATVLWRFWREPQRSRLFRSTFLYTGRLVLFWLSIAFIAEYFLTRFVPTEWIVALVGAENDFAVPLAASVGAPIYLDGYAALPLLRGLMDLGMKPDAAMAFVVAGGIVSAWAAIPVYSLVRLPVFLTYVALAVFCSMLAGWGYGLFVL